MAYHRDVSCGPNSSPQCSMEEHIYLLYIAPCINVLATSEPPSTQADQITSYLEALVLCYIERVNTADRRLVSHNIDLPHMNVLIKVIVAYEIIVAYIKDNNFDDVYRILHSTRTIRNDITIDNLYVHFTNFFIHHNLSLSDLKAIASGFYYDYFILICDGPNESCKSRLRNVNILARERTHPLLRLGKLRFSNKLEVGTKSQVWKGIAKHTSNGLTKKDLTKNKNGNVVIKR